MRHNRKDTTVIIAQPEMSEAEGEALWNATHKYLGWEKPIAIGFAECLWSGRWTGHHFLGRAFIDDNRVFQPPKS